MPYSFPPAPLLMLVSDRKRYGERTAQDLFLAALRGGVNMIQLWEPDLAPRDLLGEADRMRRLAIGGIPLIVYDRVDVAVAVGADGVHLPADGLPVKAAKKAGRHMLIGKSVSSVTEAVAADQAGASYLVVGPVFPSTYSTPGSSPLGPTTIRRIKARVKAPVLASGGITAGNAHQVIAAGADGVSVTSEVVEAHDPERAALALMAAMRAAWATRPLLRESVVDQL